jgi:hypothetical protein
VLIYCRSQRDNLIRKQDHHRSVSEVLWPTPLALFDRGTHAQDVTKLPAVELPPVEYGSDQMLALEKALPVLSPSPKGLLDKQLPALPRRPVGGYHSKTDSAASTPKVTMDDIEVGRHTTSIWSLFPMPKSMELERPATSTGYNTLPNHLPKPSLSALPEFSETVPTALPSLRRAATASSLRDGHIPVASHLQYGQTQLAPQDPKEAHGPRIGRLKKSFSVLGNITKRPSAHRGSQPTGLRKKWSALYLSTKAKNSHDGQNISAADENNLHATQTRSQPSPNDGRTGVPVEPVGIYDPTSRMWLIPQKSNAASFGIYDPDSRQWLAPSPRIDSFRRNMGTAVEDHPKRGASLDTEVTHEEEEQGALSLAEKLEMIRYNPLTRTFSTPATTVRAHPSTSNSMSDTSPSVPWKGGGPLGITTSQAEENASGLPEEEEIFVFPPHRFTRSYTEESGSGYMSFESHEERQKKNWKSIWKTTQLGKRLESSKKLTGRSNSRQGD